MGGSIESEWEAAHPMHSVSQARAIQLKLWRIIVSLARPFIVGTQVSSASGVLIESRGGTMEELVSSASGVLIE